MIVLNVPPFVASCVPLIRNDAVLSTFHRMVASLGRDSSMAKLVASVPPRPLPPAPARSDCQLRSSVVLLEGRCAAATTYERESYWRAVSALPAPPTIAHRPRRTSGRSHAPTTTLLRKAVDVGPPTPAPEPQRARWIRRRLTGDAAARPSIVGGTNASPATDPDGPRSHARSPGPRRGYAARSTASWRRTWRRGVVASGSTSSRATRRGRQPNRSSTTFAASRTFASCRLSVSSIDTSSVLTSTTSNVALAACHATRSIDPRSANTA